MDISSSAGTTRSPWRVDPFAITDHFRGRHDLELLAVFCSCVAGKKATMISGMVETLFSACDHSGTPFERLLSMERSGSLDANLRRARLGKYAVLNRGLPALARFDEQALRTCPPEALEEIPGIGMKTSRFFILHSRPDARVGVIDTHVLKYLRAAGVNGVPDTIPTGREYLRMEAAFMAEADRLEVPMAVLDLRIWSHYAAGNRSKPEDHLLRTGGTS